MTLIVRGWFRGPSPWLGPLVRHRALFRVERQVPLQFAGLGLAMSDGSSQKAGKPQHCEWDPGVIGRCDLIGAVADDSPRRVEFASGEARHLVVPAVRARARGCKVL